MQPTSRPWHPNVLTWDAFLDPYRLQADRLARLDRRNPDRGSDRSDRPDRLDRTDRVDRPNRTDKNGRDRTDRLSDRLFQINWSGNPHRDFTYTPQELHQIFEILRRSADASSYHRLRPTPSTTLRDRYALERAPWHARDLSMQFDQFQLGDGSGSGVSKLGRGSVGVGGGAGAARWEGAGAAARGWAVGAVLLAALVLLVRAAEKCLDKRLSPPTPGRRASEEWPTPNVLATSQHQLPDADNDCSGADSGPALDPPPPYSLVAAKTEDPPPPYAHCALDYTGNKDDTPTVHFYTGRTSNLPETSNSPENTSSESARSSELVFDNGRVIEMECRCDMDNGQIVSECEGRASANSPEQRVLFV